MDWIKILDSFGLAGLFGIAFVALMFCIIKWTLDFVGRLINQYNIDRENWIKQAGAERESWLKAVDKQSDAWNARCQQDKIFQEMVTEAHKYQREEHAKQVELLNGAILEHKEMILTLGRINGYKHEE